MQLSDTIELLSSLTKSPYGTIHTILNGTITEIESINKELESIRDKTLKLETKNDKLVKQFKNIIDFISKIEYCDAFTQSQVKERHDVSIDCMENVECVDASVSTNIDICEAAVQTEFEIDEKNLPVPTEDSKPLENSTISSPPSMNNLPNEPSLKEDNCELFSKGEMLFYLERYKSNFLSFVQCNKNDIDKTSGSSGDLIKSFSKQSSKVFANKSNKISTSKRRRRDSHNDKYGIIDTRDKYVDEVVRSSLYDDLDFSNHHDNTLMKSNNPMELMESSIFV